MDKGLVIREKGKKWKREKGKKGEREKGNRKIENNIGWRCGGQSSARARIKGP